MTGRFFALAIALALALDGRPNASAGHPDATTDAALVARIDAINRGETVRGMLLGFTSDDARVEADVPSSWRDD